MRAKHRVTALLCTVICTARLDAEPVPARSKIFPMSDEGAAYLIQGLPNVEAIGYPVGTNGKELAAKIHAIVEAPAYVVLHNACYKYSRRMPAGPQVQETTRNGRPYRRYIFAPPSKDTESPTIRLVLEMASRPAHHTALNRLIKGVVNVRMTAVQGNMYEDVEPT